MKHFLFGPYQVDIEITGPKTVTPKAKRLMRLAAEKTLLSLPKSVQRRFLRPKVPYGLSLSFVSDSVIRKLNARYRNKDNVTDVLSFSRLEGAPVPVPEIGDVVISFPQIKRQAKHYGVSHWEELQRLTIHGVLHLFGYDHERSKAEEKRMFRLQDKILEDLLANRFNRIQTRGARRRIQRRKVDHQGRAQIRHRK